MATLRFEDKPMYDIFSTVHIVEGEYVVNFKQQYCYEQDLENTVILHTNYYPVSTPLTEIHTDYIQVKGYHNSAEWTIKLCSKDKYKHNDSYYVDSLNSFRKAFKLCLQKGGGRLICLCMLKQINQNLLTRLHNHFTICGLTLTHSKMVFLVTWRSPQKKS